MKNLLLPLTPDQADFLAFFCNAGLEIDLIPQRNEDGTFYVDLTDPKDERGEVLETVDFQTEAEAEAFIDLCLAEDPRSRDRAFDGRPQRYLLQVGDGWAFAAWAGYGGRLSNGVFDTQGEAEEAALARTADLAEQFYGDRQTVGGLQAAWIANPDLAEVKGPRDAAWVRQLFEAAAAWSREQNRYPEDEPAAGAWLPVSDIRNALESQFTLVRITVPAA